MFWNKAFTYLALNGLPFSSRRPRGVFLADHHLAAELAHADFDHVVGGLSEYIDLAELYPHEREF